MTSATAAGLAVTGTLDVTGATTSANFLATTALNAHQTNKGVLQYGTNETTIRSYGATAGTGTFKVKTGGGGGSTDTLALTIDASQNATFAGDVTVDGFDD